MTGIIKGNARAIPLRSSSVDLIVTSPPYFGQREYRDGGVRVAEQVGSEPDPQAFLEALWAVTKECWRVLKPGGSMFVNLGDKRSGSSAPGTTTGLTSLEGAPQQQRTGMVQGARSGIGSGYTKAAFGRAKSKQLLGYRYAIGCMDGFADPDGIGWVMRQDLVWDKPNGMPESVRDRTRDGHEPWFHLCKQGRYYSAIDEIRGPVSDYSRPNRAIRTRAPGQTPRGFNDSVNESGRLPDSVWKIATHPLTIPEWLKVQMRDEGREEDHFAAFPAEWPRRLILAFAPSAICTACGDPRTPVYERPKGRDNNDYDRGPGGNGIRLNGDHYYEHAAERAAATRFLGYQCSCSSAAALTSPAVVLDPFGGTGTTAMVARALGRTGISLDLSADYNRIAHWRIFESDGAAQVADRTAGERQGTLL